MAPADSNSSLLLPDRSKLKKETDHVLARYQPLDTNDDTVLLLHAFLQYLPPDGRSNLAEDITGCQADTSLRQLASSLDTGLLRPLLAEASQTPRSTSPRFSFFLEDEDLTEDLRSALYEPVRELKEKCMERDGNRCVITGLYDGRSDDVPPGGKKARIDLAHILPYSLGQGRFSGDEERLGISTIWKALYRYFPKLRFTLGFGVNDVNSSKNAMILMKELHEEFGMFRISLRATGTPNEYRLKMSHEFQDYLELLFPQDGIVTFTAHNDARHAIPNPILLEIHAALANILDATRIRSQVERDRYDLKNKFRFLARDGSTDIGRMLSASRLSILALNKEENTDREESLLGNRR